MSETDNILEVCGVTREEFGKCFGVTPEDLIQLCNRTHENIDAFVHDVMIPRRDMVVRNWLEQRKEESR